MTEKNKSLDERIAEALREAHERGELQRAQGWGKPLDFGDGYDETPAELRMPFKVLKDAGVVPHEVTLMRRAAELHARVQAAPDAPGSEALRRELDDLQQAIALRLEHLRVTGTL